MKAPCALRWQRQERRRKKWKHWHEPGLTVACPARSRFIQGSTTMFQQKNLRSTSLAMFTMIKRKRPLSEICRCKRIIATRPCWSYMLRRCSTQSFIILPVKKVISADNWFSRSRFGKRECAMSWSRPKTRFCTRKPSEVLTVPSSSS